MRKYLVGGIIGATLVIVVLLAAQRLLAPDVEAAARTALFLDCRASIIRMFARNGSRADNAEIEGFCPTTLFDAHKAAIIACYRADSSTDGFRQCLANKGIRNPP